MMDETKLKEDLKNRLSEMDYGQIQVVAMVDRGPYRAQESKERVDATTGPSQFVTGVFAELASEFVSQGEDLITVQREAADTAMDEKSVDWFMARLKEKKHIVFLQCLELSTTEIKNFLYALKDRDLFKDSKVFLLDLPQIEYLTLRDGLTGRIEL